MASRPTAVNNVETLAHLAMIARYGHTWFREAGLPDDARHDARDRQRRDRAARRVRDRARHADRRGPDAGGQGRPSARRLSWSAGTSAPGCPPRWRGRCRCRIQACARSAARWARGSSSCCPSPPAGSPRPPAWSGTSPSDGAGQCGPCIFGLPALADALADLAYHGGRGDAADRIAGLIPLIEGRGACRHPDGATQLAASAFAAFSHDVHWHDVEGPCFGVRRAAAAAGSREMRSTGELAAESQPDHVQGPRHVRRTAA